MKIFGSTTKGIKMKLDERTLPLDLQQDIQNWLEHETNDWDWGVFYDELYGTINMYQHAYVISEDTANYLRKNI